MTVFTPQSEDTCIYEVAILLPMTLSDKEKGETVKGLEDLFKEREAALLHKDEWGRRGLAYVIEGKTEGQYILYTLEFRPSIAQELDHAVRLEKGVLRHLVLRLPEGYDVLNYSELFQEWLQMREQQAEEEKREQEEVLKRKIVQRVARQEIPAAIPVRVEVEKGKADLSEKLEELISGDDLHL